MADVDRRLAAVTRTPTPPILKVDEEAPLVDRMIRVPTEEDFKDVLAPEGNLSGDIFGSDVSEGVGLSGDSLVGSGI